MAVNEVLFDLLDAHILHVKAFDDISEMIVFVGISTFLIT